MKITDEVDWSPQQAAAQEQFKAWMDGCPHHSMFKLAGYAGTGKTTLARHLGGSDAAYMTYTAKAASVLRQKGCVGARNIDQWLYQHPNGHRPRLGSRGEFVRTHDKAAIKPKRSAKQHGGEVGRVLAPCEELEAADMIVVDEASMVPDTMMEDMLSIGKPILALYDPAQLPPIATGCGGLIAGEPDVFLTDIHRQARGNPIIQLSMAVREGKPLGTGYFGRDCMVLPTGDVRTVINCGVDQILCGTNVTRRRINEAVRARDGRTTWYPEPGERLVCLVNQHQQGLLNGSVWIARGTAFGLSRYSKEPLIRVDVEPEDGGGLPQQIVVPIASFDKCFDYAYALTVHKAQGSQWDNVVLIDESWVLERVCGIATVRWLYTGITRAAKQLTVIKRLARVPQ